MLIYHVMIMLEGYYYIPGAAVMMDGVSIQSVLATINALLEDIDHKQNLIQQLLNDSSKER